MANIRDRRFRCAFDARFALSKVQLTDRIA